MLITLFNLQLFGEGGGDGAGDGSGAFGSDGANVVGESVSQVDSGKRTGRKSNPLANVKYGIQDSPQVDYVDAGDGKTSETIVSTRQSEDRATAFENLIKGEYKAEFDQRVQNIINKRFGETKRADEQMKQLQPMLDMLSEKYGTDKGDYEALTKSIQDDDSYYEDEAIKKGLTVKQLKEMKQLERDNASLREAQQEAQKREQSKQIFQGWMDQTQAFNDKYGMNIDFAVEAENPDFTAILKTGGSVEAAYNAVHFHEMMGGAMYKTAQAVSQKIANNIQSGVARPVENGISSRATAVTKTDVNSLTRRDREEIERRAARGEKIRF